MVGVSYFKAISIFITMSISKAQAEALRDGFLNTLGMQDYQKGSNDLPVVEKMMALAGLAFNDSLVKYLGNSVASGKLAEPSLPKISKFGNVYTMTLGYEKGSAQSKYYDFVNKGVKGTDNIKADEKTPYSYKAGKLSVPVKPIEQWLKYNKLKAVSVKKYTKLGVESKAIESKKSLAWAVAKAIHRDGLKSTHYMDRAVSEVFNKQFIETMQVALGGDIQIKIRQIGNNSNK